MNKRTAQDRVDRIRAFRREMEQLAEEGALTLSEEQRTLLNRHYEDMLANLAKQFDVDVSESQKQISLGMQIASALGGLAFCAAIVLFFYRYWGSLTTSLQVGILVAAPILGLAAMEPVSRREKTQYYTMLIGLVVFGAFVLNLNVLGIIFNLTPTPNALLAWGIFGLLLAYAYKLRMLLAAGLISLALYLGATGIVWTGAFWGSFLERPESFLLIGMATAIIPTFLSHRTATEFPGIYRLIGLLFAFISLLILGHAGNLSFLPYSKKAVEVAYQILSFATAAAVITLGIRHRLQGTVNLGSAFFVIYLFWRLTDWWWDWMPKYLFFFIIGSIALVLLAVFRRLRLRMSGGQS